MKTKSLAGSITAVAAFALFSFSSCTKEETPRPSNLVIIGVTDHPSDYYDGNDGNVDEDGGESFNENSHASPVKVEQRHEELNSDCGLPVLTISKNNLSSVVQK